MSDAVPVTMFVPAISGGILEVEAWARTETSPLCVHLFCAREGPPSKMWVVSHKTVGKALTQYDQCSTRDEALKLADQIEPLAEWSKLTRKEEGWTDQERAAASDALTEFLLARRANSKLTMEQGTK
jgi:hypothetical protein